jgi:hypothetical protein
MDALVIGPAGGIADAVAGILRRRGMSALRAIAADVADGERATWLLDEAGDPPLVVVVESAPYESVLRLMGLTQADLLLVAEQRAASASPAARPVRSLPPRDELGLAVVPLARAGRRWFAPGARRHEPMSAERAAAFVLRSAGAAVPSA